MTTTARPAARRRGGRRTRRAGALDRLLARLLAALERPEAPYLVALTGFLAVGLFLRLDELGRQSLWFDEADVVVRAQAPLTTILRDFVTAGQNGPLYTLFLHGWTALWDTSEVAVRLPSALAGAATIPLIYAVGRLLHGPRLGLYAAGIITVAPYQHWYAREAKMYALVTFATLAATALLLLALRDNRRRQWLAYVVVMTLSLQLHVTAALVLAAHLLFVVTRRAEGGGRNREEDASRQDAEQCQDRQGTPEPSSSRPVPPSAFRLPRSPRPIPHSWWAFAALTLPYLPVAAWQLRFVRGGTVTWHPSIGPLDYLRETLTRFTAGFRADGGTEVRALLLYGLLAGLGALPLAWRHGPGAAWGLGARERTTLLVGLVVIPLGLFYAVTTVRPLYSDRYLIIITPALYLLTAGGVLLLERFAHRARPFVGPLALVLVLALAWPVLRDVNLTATAQKEDWREAYRHIAVHAHPGDIVIVHPGYLDTTLAYYRERSTPDSPLVVVPGTTVPARYTEGRNCDDWGGLDPFLQRATAGFERVWLLRSPERLRQADPCDRLRDWYRYNARLIDERELNGLTLGLYVYPHGPFGAPYYPPVPVPLGIAFGDRIVLAGYGYDFPPDRGAVRPGGMVPLVLRWTFPHLGDPGRFALRWRLLDEDGAEVAGVGAVEPLFGDRSPRDEERRGEVWDYHDLRLPATLPPGRYRVIIACVPRDRPDTPLSPGTVPLGWIDVRP